MARLQHLALFSQLLLLPFSNAIDAEDLVMNSYQYCIKYYGSLQADVELPDSVPDYNYNGTELCPASFTVYPGISGATLEICPPYTSYEVDGLALSASLSFHSTGGQLDGPIDVLSLEPTLITNGSVRPSHFEGGGIPAVLAKDIHESEPLVPVWTINGTAAALTESPAADDHTQGVYISCDYPSSNVYCGGYEDTHDTVTGGCWRQQDINFNMQADLNYTFRFDRNEASAEIWVAAEYVTYLGNRTGAATQLYLRFGGTRHLPSVVDYDFWENSESDYEVESQYFEERKGMDLEEDERGLPVLVNRTETAEWYDCANGTYAVQKINGGSRSIAVDLSAAAMLLALGILSMLV